MSDFDEECGICNKPIKADDNRIWEWGEELAHMECILRLAEQICIECGYLTNNDDDKCGDCGGKLRKLTEKDKNKLMKKSENQGCKMKDEIRVDEGKMNIIIVNGKRYRLTKAKSKIIDHKLHGGELIFVPTDEEQHKKDIEYIIDNISKIIDKKELLTEFFDNMETDRVRKIKNLIKKNAKIKTTRGCFGITIGDDKNGEYVQLA